MGRKPSDVWQGTLALMILKSLDTMGAMHGYGIARRIEQVSDTPSRSTTAPSTLALLKLEQRAPSSASGALRAEPAGALLLAHARRDGSNWKPPRVNGTDDGHRGALLPPGRRVVRPLRRVSRACGTPHAPPPRT
jgi:hypothetical protein